MAFASEVSFQSILPASCLNDLMAGLLAAGLLLLFASLIFVHKLTRELPPGVNLVWWKGLGILIILFIMGYLVFGYMKFGNHYTGAELLVPVVFFFGAMFVLLVCYRVYRTAIDIKRIYILEHETITDPLLGIFNRRYLDRRLQEEVLRARRHRLDLTVLLLDIDHFKKINDTWGHQVGDLVLKSLVDLLVDTLRQTDTVARYGGEEFVALLPHTSGDEAFLLAERLRQVVEDSILVSPPADGAKSGIGITISIGLACLSAGAADAADLLVRADKALYKAKQEGRNQVVRCRQCRNSSESTVKINSGYNQFAP